MIKQLRLKNETFKIRSCFECLLQFGGDGSKVCTFTPFIKCNYNDLKNRTINSECPLEDAV